MYIVSSTTNPVTKWSTTVKSLALLSFCGLLALSACDNPFGADKIPPAELEPPEPPAPEATTPEQLMDNLDRAMDTRDPELYESLLDKDFLFTEKNCLLEVAYFNNLEEELEIMGGSRDGSRPGIFDIYLNFEYSFELDRRDQELGAEYPEAFPGDPDGHPDEDWEIFYGRVQMTLVDENGDGFRVDQNMTYKLRLDPDDNLWKIVRWENDALTGSCGEAGKPLATAFSWAALKQQVAP